MISLIVAFAKNNVIGKDGKIPWNIDGEQSRFKELTKNNIVIMERNLPKIAKTTSKQNKYSHF